MKKKTNNLKAAVTIAVTLAFVSSGITVIADEQHRTIPLGDTLLFEGFEDGIMPPPGWTQIITNTNQYYTTWCIRDRDAHTGTYCTEVAGDPDPQDEWIISPSLDFSGDYDGIYLEFWWVIFNKDAALIDDLYDLNVKISTDGGSNWTLIWNETYIEEPWYGSAWFNTSNDDPVDLSAYIGETNVTIGFQFEGEGNWPGNGAILDDILVYGIEDTTPPETTCELEGEMVGDVYVSEVTVTLTATDDMSGVNYTMVKVDDGEYTEYEEPFVVSDEGEHTIYYYSVDNANNIEDEKTTNFTIRYPAEIEIGDITGGFLKVDAEIKNTGETDATNVSWKISLQDGIILVGGEASGSIATLKAGNTETVTDSPVLGFGSVDIIVTASADGVEEVEKTAKGFVFVVFVFITG
jgi:hypothetical protein